MTGPEPALALTATPGRRSVRSERRGPGPAAVLAVLAPVVAVVASLLVPAQPDPAPRPPTAAELTVSALSCPGAAAGGTVSVSSLSGPGAGSGEVSAGIVDPTPVDVRPGRVSLASSQPDATVLTGAGALAPGLVATRTVATPLATLACGPLISDQWFTGAGAAAAHRSVLELVNPDDGPAVADVTLLSPTGPVDAPGLRGVAVAPGTVASFDLSQVTPRRGDLTVRVQTTRGRLGVSVLDVEEVLGGGVVTSDWLPAQSAPAPVNILVGLVRGAGPRRLVVGNPGDDEAQVQVELITPRSVFAPEGLAPFRVPPRSSVRVSLDDLLAEAAGRGALGLRITASVPVTAGLRQLTPDLSLLSPLDEVQGATAVVVPPGRSRLQLVSTEEPVEGEAAAAGTTVTVRATDDAGTVLDEREVELAPGTASNTALPAGTTLVRVDPGDLALRGAVVVREPGVTVLELATLARTSNVPDVRPGLP